MAVVFEKTLNILVFDRDRQLREGLRNFLLTSGYTRVHVIMSIRSALLKLRQERLDVILLGASPPIPAVRRLARVAQYRQPAAKIFLLVAASDQPSFIDVPDRVILKEYMYSNLLELL